MRRALLAALALLVTTGAHSAIDIPYLTGRVTDNAEILNADTRRDLTAQLAEHERATTNQVAVLTVKTLAGESIEDYANAVFRAWQLGRKDKNNGVLILIAPQERRLRIEVGYGLEGALTDLIAGPHYPRHHHAALQTGRLQRRSARRRRRGARHSQRRDGRARRNVIPERGQEFRQLL